MHEWLKRKGLIVEQKVTFDLPRHRIIEILENNVPPFSSSTPYIKKPSSKFSGVISSSSFRIQEQRSMLNSSQQEVTVYGSFQDEGNKTIILTEANGMTTFSWMFVILFPFSLLTFPLFLDNWLNLSIWLPAVLFTGFVMYSQINAARNAAFEAIFTFDAALHRWVELANNKAKAAQP